MEKQSTHLLGSLEMAQVVTLESFMSSILYIKGKLASFLGKDI